MGQPKISDKRWSVDLEKRIQSEHYNEESYRRRYAFNKETDKEIFVIDTPPPYPSGTWHIGAVAQYSMIDVIARSQRLLGKEVKFPGGWIGMASISNSLLKRRQGGRCGLMIGLNS